MSEVFCDLTHLGMGHYSGELSDRPGFHLYVSFGCPSEMLVGLWEVTDHGSDVRMLRGSGVLRLNLDQRGWSGFLDEGNKSSWILSAERNQRRVTMTRKKEST